MTWSQNRLISFIECDTSTKADRSRMVRMRSRHFWRNLKSPTDRTSSASNKSGFMKTVVAKASRIRIPAL